MQKKLIISFLGQLVDELVYPDELYSPMLKFVLIFQ